MSRLQRIAASPYAWSAGGGLALAAAFPKFAVAGLAWVAPGWILFSALGRRGSDAFRIGYVGGLAYALAAFYWLLFIPFPAGAIAGWLALSAYLALYTGTWVWWCWWSFPNATGLARQERSLRPGPQELEVGRAVPRAPSSFATSPFAADPGQGPAREDALSEKSKTVSHEDGARGTSGPTAQLCVATGRDSFLAVPLPQRILWAVGCAAVWVCLEMILARLFTGFPWNLVGVSQYQMLPLLQVAPFTGVYGVSFLVVWFSVALAGAALKLISQPTQSKAWMGDLLLPLLVLVGVLTYGSSQLTHRSAPSRTVKAVLIQPSIPQTLIWDTNQNAMRFTQLTELSRKALEQTTNAQLLIWPEAAVPNMLRYEWDTYRAVTNLAVAHHVWVILGSDDAVARGGVEGRYDFFNSGFLVMPTGEIATNVYRKRQLVIFGEYIPLERWMSFIKYLTPIGGSFTAGKGPVPFEIPDLQMRTSVLICYEDNFPHLCREYVTPETDFLLNLTNNGWFGESAAQWQHAANAVFRTVENRIPLVRCTNNGLTCWVDSNGGMHDVYFPGSKDVYGAGFKTVDIPLLSPGERRQPTFYNRHGDWFGWSCVGLTALWVGETLLRAYALRRLPRS